MTNEVIGGCPAELETKASPEWGGFFVPGFFPPEKYHDGLFCRP